MNTEARQIKSFLDCYITTDLKFNLSLNYIPQYSLFTRIVRRHMITRQSNGSTICENQIFSHRRLYFQPFRKTKIIAMVFTNLHHHMENFNPIEIWIANNFRQAIPIPPS